MSYVRENDSTQNAHIKHSNDNRQKAYMKKHREDKGMSYGQYMAEQYKKEVMIR